jgi:hypothetical protein
MQRKAQVRAQAPPQRPGGWEVRWSPFRLVFEVAKKKLARDSAMRCASSCLVCSRLMKRVMVEVASNTDVLAGTGLA